MRKDPTTGIQIHVFSREFQQNTNTCIQFRARTHRELTAVSPTHATAVSTRRFRPGRARRFRNAVAAAHTVQSVARAAVPTCSLSHRQSLRRRRRPHPSHHPQLLPSVPRASPPARSLRCRRHHPKAAHNACAARIARAARARGTLAVCSAGVRAHILRSSSSSDASESESESHFSVFCL